MLRLRLGETAMLGLTDTNVARLTVDEPILLDLDSLTSPEYPEPPATLVIFHATREALTEIAEAKGIDLAVLLEQLGEG